jgi:hypothetical protein
VTIEADASGGLSIVASLNGLTKAIDGWTARMDREALHRQQASQSYRQVPIGKGINTSGSATTSHVEPHGPPQGYYWSIRRLTAYYYTAGTVTVFKDSPDGVAGEPLVAFPAAAVYTFGKGEMLLSPMSQLLITWSSITPTTGNFIYIWGAADQFETWLLPWYMGTQRDD